MLLFQVIYNDEGRVIRRIIERVTEVTRRTRIVRRIIIDEFGNERVFEEEVPIEEIENPMEDDDEDQMVVVAPASDGTPGSPRVEPLKFEARQVRSAHFEYKSDEEEKNEKEEEPDHLPATSEEESADELQNEEAEFVPIVRSRGTSKRIALRHEDDEVASKRKVCGNLFEFCLTTRPQVLVYIPTLTDSCRKVFLKLGNEENC